MYGTKRKNMRKIFSFIAILGIYIVFANAHTPLFATNNAGQSAYFAAADEPDSLDAKKSKIVEDLKAKKGSTEKDVVKSFIDKSIDDINNATSVEQVDKIAELILAKVNACLDIENKEKQANNVLETSEREQVTKSYTDIINADDLERVNTLKREVLDMMDLRILKASRTKNIQSRFNKIPETAKNSGDTGRIDGFIDKILKAKNKNEVSNAFEEAKTLLETLEIRAQALQGVKDAIEISNPLPEVMDFINVIKKEIIYSYGRREILNKSKEILALIGANFDQLEAILSIHGAMPEVADKTVFFNHVRNQINDIVNTDDKGNIEELQNTALKRLNNVTQFYNVGRESVIGTLGTPQKGPIIEVTDQNNRVITLYNPKKVEFKKEK